MPDEFLTEKEVSAFTRLAIPTLRNHRHLGKGFPYFKIGRAVLYKRSDILSFIERHRVEPKEEERGQED